MEAITKFLPVVDQDKNEMFLPSAQSPRNLTGAATITSLQNKPVLPLSPADNPEQFEAAEKRVLLAFFVKLQREGIGAKDSAYRIIAQRIVEESARREMSIDDLDAACHNYEMNVKIYGDRIEPAEFFSGFTPPALYPYAWALEENHKHRGAFAQMDSYLHVATNRGLYRYSDGKRYEIPGFILMSVCGQLTPEGTALQQRARAGMFNEVEAKQ